MNIIITNVGRRGYLVDYFKEIKGFDGKVYTSDCDRTACGLYGCNDGFFILPKPVDDEELYVDELISLCIDKDIKVVISVIDPEIYILSKYKERFANRGITVVVSDKRVLDICYDKLKMNGFLDMVGIRFPKTYASIDEFSKKYDAGEIDFPVIIKPICGSGSSDTYFIDNMQKLSVLYSEGMLIQEKLEGTEYGIDVFNSFDGVPLRCVIKRKLSMRSGETDKSVSVHDQAIQETMLNLASGLKHIGNLDCDIIVRDNIPYVIDMNPRFGGGYMATHAIGVNLIELLYRLLCGEAVTPEFGIYNDNVLVMKGITVSSVVL